MSKKNQPDDEIRVTLRYPRKWKPLLVAIGKRQHRSFNYIATEALRQFLVKSGYKVEKW